MIIIDYIIKKNNTMNLVWQATYWGQRWGPTFALCGLKWDHREINLRALPAHFRAWSYPA